MLNKATQSERITVTMLHLHNNDKVSVEDLVDEFSVNIRTIYRDIESLKKFGVDITIDNSYIALKNKGTLEQFTFDELEEMTLYVSMNMASNVSTTLKNKAKNLKNKFLSKNYDSSYLVKLDPYEDIDIDSDHVNTLEEAIRRKRVIQFIFKGKKVQASPFKIINIDEIWYLFARDVESKKLKTYYISDMKNIEEMTNKINEENDIDEIIANIQTPWYEDTDSFEVVVEILQPIAHYFIRKKHLPSQKILEKREDGSILVRFKVTSEEEVDNLIKSWLPEMKVISPKSLADKIKQELKDYLAMLV